MAEKMPALKLHIPLLARTPMFKDDGKARQYDKEVHPHNEESLIYIDVAHLILKETTSIDMDQV